MTKLSLFQALCSLADALQDECVRVDFSPHKLALEAILDRLDVLIDDVLCMHTETIGEDDDHA